MRGLPSIDDVCDGACRKSDAADVCPASAAPVAAPAAVSDDGEALAFSSLLLPSAKSWLEEVEGTLSGVVPSDVTAIPGTAGRCVRAASGHAPPSLRGEASGMAAAFLDLLSVSPCGRLFFRNKFGALFAGVGPLELLREPGRDASRRDCAEAWPAMFADDRPA